MRRALAAGCRVVEVFDRWEIFERDGWICQVCGRETTRDPDPYNPSSPTVDHIVPLAAGGEHSRANVRLACMGCNSARRDLLIA
jgi:5-methylcytosine-specific restriction endonuclease McrA